MSEIQEMDFFYYPVPNCKFWMVQYTETPPSEEWWPSHGYMIFSSKKRAMEWSSERLPRIKANKIIEGYWDDTCKENYTSIEDRK